MEALFGWREKGTKIPEKIPATSADVCEVPVPFRMPMMKINRVPPSAIALVEQDRELCSRIRDILGRAGFHVRAVFHTHGDAIRSIDWSEIDILLCGVTGSRCMGGDFVRQVRAENPSLLAVFLAGEERSGILETGLSAGVRGFLLKADIEDQLDFWLRHLLDGGVAIHPRLARSFLSDEPDASRSKGDPVLTHRELQILSMLGEGGLYKQIADHLGISVHTVHNHAKRIYAKLGVGSRSEAIRAASNGSLAMQLGRLREKRSTVAA